MRVNTRNRFIILPFFLSLCLLMQSPEVLASYAGHNMKGDFGLQTGSQPAPGFYAIAPMYYRYETDTLRDKDGNKISPDPQDRGDLTANAYVFGLIWVSAVLPR